MNGKFSTIDRSGILDFIEEYGRANQQFTFSGYTYTLEQLLESSKQLAEKLYWLGIREGDRIGLAYVNNGCFLKLMFAAYRLQATIVYVSPKLLAAEIIDIAHYCSMKMLFVDEHYKFLFELLPRSPIPVYRCGQHEISELTNTSRAPIVKGPAINPDTAVLFTSGSSSKPKGAVLGANSYILNAWQIGKHIGASADDHILCSLPMCYISAQVTAFFVSIVFGCNITFLDRFSVQAFNQLVTERDITVTNLVPSFIHQLGRGHTKVPNRLRVVLCGGAQLQQEDRERFLSLYGTDITEGYGSTEGGCGITINPVDKPKNGSVGIPLTGQEIYIVDPEDHSRQLGANEVGEILVRNDTAFRGYLNQEEETKAAFSQGFYRTYDLGRVDEEGYLYITGRLKSMINRGGEKIYPGEIEKLIGSIEGVEEAYVFGVPDEQLGQTVGAIIVTDDLELSSEQIIEQLSSKVSRYKLPEHIYFVHEIPKTVSGKVDGVACMEMLRRGGITAT
ncbi:class I adenylate-forming enzyme family protein [Paenibacillus xylaniclasticus]|uniref:class I adenylate-forming enzyme family protein n=1 Tax=Paenibacillus xylaniclasticus TaxID=588083 RepID=UPI000FD7A8B5|nr:MULTISPECIES: class I adenylate-forming enzyme family protein [Paenibacillus]GFN32230.1 long-chain-fatty-acid--CoA ligase [Paenibacillus curdlanolyticus]